jgi:hypothetical protein
LSQFIEWKREMLRRRQLGRPDGRNLYEYRLTTEEFTDLETLLRTWLRASKFDLSVVSRHMGFAALFVLYAAERWRRRFDGSQWSWEPILRDIGASPYEWSQAQRSECVQLGLQDWTLTPRETGGLRFLGTIAVQGGLPLRLLAEARGRIGNLLGTVFNLAGGSAVTPADLETWVSSLQERLPRSYRLEVIFRLLANVAWTVLRLKEQAQLGAATNPIEVLNRQIPGWRDQFPLPIEDDQAQKLIEQLVRDAASVRPQRRAISLPVERHIEVVDQSRWILHSNLTLPDSITVFALAQLFGAPADELPRFGELTLVAGDHRFAVTVRRMAGHDRYRIDRAHWEFSGEAASEEHLLHFSAPDGRIWTMNAPRGEALDDELPWVFGIGDVTNPFVRQGSGGIAATEALVALPPDWSLQGEEGSEVKECGLLEFFSRSVYRFRGTVRTHGTAGLVCRLRTGQAGAAEESYEWRGHRLWLDMRYPTMAFKGLPRLYRISQEGEARPMEGNSAWNTIGGALPSNAQPLGPISMRYPTSGALIQRTSLVALPQTAGLSMEFIDARSGAIRLENWHAKAARVRDQYVQIEIGREENALVISMRVASADPPPAQVEIEVYWAHTPTAVRLSVPFPARGVRVLDGDRRELHNGSLIAVQRLTGVRLSVLRGPNNTRMTLEIGAGHGGPLRTHELRSLPGAYGVNVRLQDYATDIQHLLSTNDGPDAQVRIIVRIGGEEHFRLFVARYAAKLERDPPAVSLDSVVCQMLTPEEIRSLPVLALCLERLGDEAIALEPIMSEGVPVGAWKFSPEVRAPGSWLIYPGSDAQLPFRPTLWTIPGQMGSTNSLVDAMRLPNPEEREAALDEVIEGLAANFQDPCWTEIERLAGQVGHLPLATFDLWRRIVRSPRGMAALAIRFGALPRSLLNRFHQELPFVWEAVSLTAWRQAIGYLKEQCDGMGGGAGALIFKTHLDSRVSELTAGNGALHFLLGIASAAYSEQSTQQIRLLRALGEMAEYQLFNPDGGLVMHLRQIHAEDNWPTGFDAVIVRARAQPEVARFLYPQSLGFADGAINLPLILAAQVATDQSEHWFSAPDAIHVLRAHRAFDPEYFDHAYNLTVARCLVAGLLDG